MRRLRSKMLLYIFVPTMLFFIGITLYVSSVTHEIVKEGGEDLLEEAGQSLALELRLELEKSLEAVETLSHSFAGIIDRASTPRRENANVMLQQLLEQHPNVLSAWMFWDENAFDGLDAQYVNTEGHDETGRFIPVWSRTDSGEFLVEPVVDYDTDSETAHHLNHVLQTGERAIWEPFIYEIDGEAQLITSLVAPVVVNGKTLGMTGVDIALDDLHYLVSDYTYYRTGFAGLVSNAGHVISHQNEALIGTNYFASDGMKDHAQTEQVKKAVAAGGKSMVEGRSALLERDVFRLFTPLRIDGISTPWSALVVAPVDEVSEEADSVTVMILIVNTVVIVILATIILLVTRAIVRPVRHAVTYGSSMAEGNFALQFTERELKRKDEFGELNRMFAAISENMRDLLGQVQQSSRMVLEAANSLDEGAGESTAAANEVATTIADVSQSAEEQRQSAEESAKAMEDMTQGVQRVSVSASAVAETAGEMTERANAGQTTVQQAIAQMEQIQKETHESKEVITQLQRNATQIENIVAMITDISEQTNLLALNAAIEAARAGDAGQGFAVVADEVRKLADETKDSAMHIQDIVGQIQTDTGQANASMDTSEREVQEGMTRIVAVGEVFTQINNFIQEVVKEIEDLAAVSEQMSAMSEEIAAASEEIASSAEVASDNTQQVAAAAEQQLATMEEMRRTSQTLKGMADELRDLLQQFRV